MSQACIEVWLTDLEELFVSIPIQLILYLCHPILHAGTTEIVPEIKIHPEIVRRVRHLQPDTH